MRTPDGIEILGKSNKANQQTVIYEVLKVFGRKKWFMNLDIKIFSGDKQLVPKNDNVEVTLNDERRYSSIFFTVNNIISILKNYKETGKCCHGLYFWASDIIIVEVLTKDVINKTIIGLINCGEFYSCFSLLKY
ncbi:hypothetical protein QVM87_20525 [Providencia stuartii]|nr:MULTISPECIES: hypothetical protein [Providencia]MDN0012403.1 hypothetical protein [Providencia stuartii]MDN7225072.1 hypothetical protein [Providencia stuartii]MDQ5990418.1 hypothetical protein [Providencia stuartii]